MRLTFCGVRGSTPASGPEFVRAGGHTSCVAVAHDGGPPTLLLDAGTGIRGVSTLLRGAPFRGSILLGHLHWDHTQGLPFFAGGDRPDAEVDLYLPAQGAAEVLLSRMMSPPFFPIPPSGLRGSWRFLELGPGVMDVEGFAVQSADISHSPGRTFGYRISDGGASVAYLSDHRPAPGYLGDDGPWHEEAALALAAGCDVLVHDAQHLDHEYADKAFMGHSPVGYALALAVAAGAKQLVLFHHDPSRTDDQLDALQAAMADAPLPVTIAVEGLEMTLPSQAPAGTSALASGLGGSSGE